MSALSFDVAVIGAGFSGAALTIQLLERMPAGSRVALIGTPGEIGSGLAYRPESPDLVLNVRANRMSLHADDEEDFVRWLAERSKGGRPLFRGMLGQLYVSRSAYGNYVRDTLLRAIEQARHRVAVTVIPGRAIAMARSEDEFRIELADGETIIAASAALCLGNMPSAFPLRLDAIVPAALNRLIADPWNDPRMAAIDPDARVLFIGTGLTMFDQALLRERAGHRGGMSALSRHGLLPAAQPRSAVRPVAIDLPAGNPRLSVLFRTVVGAARAAGGDWRAVIDGLRPASQEMWQRLSPAGKRRFLRHVEAYWSVHRHRMAPAVGEKITAMHDDGRLDVVAGRLVAVRRTGEALTVTLRRRGSAEVEEQAFDWIVNCTGPGRYASLAGEPLVARMVDRGLARPDRLRLSLDVSREGALIGRNREVAANLFALGPLARGRFFEITAAREIRAQAGEVAERLAALKLAQTFPRGLPRNRGVHPHQPLTT